MKAHVNTSRRQIFIISLFLLAFLVPLFIPAVSWAAGPYTNTQLEGMLPYGIQSSINWDTECKDYLRGQPGASFNDTLRTRINTNASYHYRVWISERDTPNRSNPVKITEGARRVPLQVNGVNFLCRTLIKPDLTNGCSNKSVTARNIIQSDHWAEAGKRIDWAPNPVGGDCMFPARTNISVQYNSIRVASTTAANQGSVDWNGPVVVNTGRDGSSRFWFANRTINFNYDSNTARGFTHDNNVTFRVRYKQINSYFNGSVHQCLNSSNSWINVGGAQDYSRCRVLEDNYTVQIRVEKNNVPTGQLRIVCRDPATNSQRVSYSNVRDVDGATTSYVQGPSGRYIAINSNRSGYKDVKDANGGNMYRLFVKDVGPNGSGNFVQVASARTVACNSPTTSRTETVRITPVVRAVSGDIEPTETAQYRGYATVSNFPQTNEWGYREQSVQLDAERVQASGRSTLQSQSRQRTGTATGSYGASCTRYWSNGSCRTYTCYYYNASLSGSTCYYTYTYTYYEYRYRCEYGSWGAWGGGAPSCRQYWTCPGGASGGNVYAWSAPTCNGWRCQYPSAQINQVPQPTCEARCDGGRGTWTAPLSYGTYYTYGDRNCYVEPHFTITCYWPETGKTETDTVRYPGTRQYCPSDESKVGQSVGQLLCMEYTAEYPDRWITPRRANTPPGFTPSGQTTNWIWDVNPDPASDCSRVVARPTVKVSGGDVAAGGAFASGSMCSGGSTSHITGWPHEPYYDGSGSEYGVFASGAVYGFASATLGAGESSPPRSLTFANTVGSGLQYGGNFGGMPCIPDYAGHKPSGPLPSVSLPALNAGGYMGGLASGSYQSNGASLGNGGTVYIPVGKQVAIYVNGDVHIRSNIEYIRSGWSDLDQIPAFKLVVSGNITIDRNVTKLDGVYIAQPTNSANGQIVTCADNRGPVATNNIFNQCQTQLTVNGVFVAKKVRLLRTQGTQIFGTTAEQFNYLPELWLANWPDDDTSEEIKYDSITSLPPVL